MIAASFYGHFLSIFPLIMNGKRRKLSSQEFVIGEEIDSESDLEHDTIEDFNEDLSDESLEMDPYPDPIDLKEICCFDPVPNGLLRDAAEELVRGGFSLFTFSQNFVEMFGIPYSIDQQKQLFDYWNSLPIYPQRILINMSTGNCELKYAIMYVRQYYVQCYKNNHPAGTWLEIVPYIR